MRKFKSDGLMWDDEIPQCYKCKKTIDEVGLFETALRDFDVCCTKIACLEALGCAALHSEIEEIK